MTKILAFSGKKQSGKTSGANWIVGQVLVANNVLHDFHINDNGELIVPYDFGNDVQYHPLDMCDKRPIMQEYLAEKVWPHVKVYSFADILKESVMNIFGIEYKQLYGSDDEKNQLTKYTREDFAKLLGDKIKIVNPSPNYMSGRDILQIFGTDICRTIYYDVWVDACIRQIKKDDSELAIIIDCRFFNEIEAVHKEYGKVIRLTRNIHPEDTHESETALDNCSDFDYILDNSNITIEQKNQKINEKMSEWDYNMWDWLCEEK
jgi:hypothetical protein